MSKNLEKKPFVIEFKNNYGTANSAGKSQPSIFRLRGQSDIQIRGHCHRQRIEGVDVHARKKLIIASCICLFFMVCEVIGGVLSNSLAIATDAAHLLSDFASFMISLFAIWIAGRPATQRMSFGWYRAEVIGALVSVFMIWVITAILVWMAIQRCIYQDFELDATVMLITSGLAILVNFIMGVQLHMGGPGHGHSHGGHGHSHGGRPPVQDKPGPIVSTPAANSIAPAVTSDADTSIVEGGLKNKQRNSEDSSIDSQSFSEISYQENKKDSMKAVTLSPIISAVPPKNVGQNMNVRAAYIHVIGDGISSVGVFIASLIIFFKPEWALADPICTFIFSIIVLFTTFNIMKDALLVLMEGTPTYLDYAEVMEVFLQIEGVERVHNLRIWALSINKVALSAHLAIKPGANPRQILKDATAAVHLNFNFFETTIQIEDFTPEMENCQQCIVPDR